MIIINEANYKIIKIINEAAKKEVSEDQLKILLQELYKEKEEKKLNIC